jgi:hypothetical protein
MQTPSDLSTNSTIINSGLLLTFFAAFQERHSGPTLEGHFRLDHPGLLFLKTGPLMDPLRKEPRFQAVMRELKFPT